DEKLDLASAAHRVLRADPRPDVPWDPDLTVIVFRARADDTASRYLLIAINSTGPVDLSSVSLRRRFYLRICFPSHRLRPQHARRALDTIREALDDLQLSSSELV